MANSAEIVTWLFVAGNAGRFVASQICASVLQVAVASLRLLRNHTYINLCIPRSVEALSLGKIELSNHTDSEPQMTTNRVSLTLTAISAAVILTACGGGGSDSSPSTAAATPAPLTCPTGQTPDGTGKSCVVTFVASNLDTATYTFAGDSSSGRAFNDLNTARSQCGFGSLKQNALLDKAARSHADYLNTDASPSLGLALHNEIVGKPFFTGVTPEARVSAAGYSRLSASEGILGFMAKKWFDLNQVGMKDLLAAPYHQVDALRGWKEVGVSVRDAADAGINNQKSAYLVLNYATPFGSTDQLLSSTDVQTYPCQGVTGTAYELTGEYPSVQPGRDYQKNPVGQGIAVMVRDGQELKITTASVKESATGAPVPLQTTLTSYSDVNGHIQKNEAVVIPDVALKPNTTYLVEISGTNSGQSFAKTFTFTTGMY